MNTKEIIEKFKTKYSNNPLLVRSPGRINIIGEHTDYNDGFVFPAAINKEIHFAVAENSINKFRFYAFDLKESFEMDVENLAISNTSWANYLLGVAAQFKKAGYNLQGVDCVFGGNIPLGAGLSSSAALENGFAFALNEIFNFKLSKLKLVKMAQKAEHEYASVNCGIMDQFASMNGKKNNALKLDCRTLSFDFATINLENYGLILCDTKVKHQLASSEYNTRRKECETGVQLLQQYNSSITALRDVNLELLEKHKNEFDSIVYKRCKFFVQENKRVEKAFTALQRNDMEALGALLFQSHQGLRDDYQVSCKELDVLASYAQNSKDVIGARMMGGGFGGCTINIVKQEKLKSFSNRITAHYIEKTGITPEIYTVEITDGTGLI